MSNSESVSTEISPVFGTWLSQWRLIVIERSSAQPVLASVLDSMQRKSACAEINAFWRYLQQFFVSGSDREPEKLLQDPETLSQLMRQARSLLPQDAKRLLEHLSRCYSLNGEGASFWLAVEKALAPPDPAKPELNLNQPM